MRTASTLLDRQAFADLAGLSFEGVRNTFTALGYDSVLTPAKYRAKYERGGIAERIVEALPKATWRGGGELIEDEDPDALTPFEEAWNGIEERLHAWTTFQRADILAGLGRYSVLLIGARGDLSTELPKGSGKPDNLLYLQPYDEENAQIEDKDREKSKESPRFGLPNFYTVNLQATVGTKSEKVHWTRILHIAEGQLATELYGKPRLRAVWNYLLDLEKVHGAGAEAFWQRVNPLFQVQLEPETEYDEDEEALMEEEVDELVHGQRRWARTRGLEIHQFATAVSAIGPNVDSLLMLISATTGIPHRILTGSERGELASSQDRNNWNERVQDRRDGYAGPLVVRPLVDRLIEFNYLPPPSAVTGYRVQWPEMKNLEDDERVGIAKGLSEVNKNEGTTVYIKDEIRAVTGHPPFAEVADEAEMAGEEDPETEIEDDEDAADLAVAESFADVETPPDEPAWKAIHRAADRNRARLARALELGFVTASRKLDMHRLEVALAARDRTLADFLAAQALAAGDEALREPLEDGLLQTLIAGGRAAAKASKKLGRFASAQPRTADEKTDADEPPFSIAFDVENPLARAWAHTRAAQLIVEIGNETRQAVRDLIARAFAEGIAPKVAAREVKQLIGLNSLQERAVKNLEREIREALPGALIERAEGKFKVRVPAKGASEGFIRARVAKYVERMHRLRAVTISRSETLAAANEGQRQLWEQAKDKGLIDANDVERVWIATPDDRTCPICMGLDGERAGLDENFSLGVLNPPAHPDCRCTTGLQERRRRSAA